jgi:hypothetical protein
MFKYDFRLPGENFLLLPGALLRFKYYHTKTTTLLNNSNSLTRKNLIENVLGKTEHKV